MKMKMIKSFLFEKGWEIVGGVRHIQTTPKSVTHFKKILLKKGYGDVKAMQPCFTIGRKLVKGKFYAKNFSDILIIGWGIPNCIGCERNELVTKSKFAWYNFPNLETLTLQLRVLAKKRRQYKRDQIRKTYFPMVMNAMSPYMPFFEQIITGDDEYRPWYSLPGWEGATPKQLRNLFDFLKEYFRSTNSPKETRGALRLYTGEIKQKIDAEFRRVYKEIRELRWMDKRGKKRSEIKKKFSFNDTELKDVLERDDRAGVPTGKYVCNPKTIALQFAFSRNGIKKYPESNAPRLFKVRPKKV